MRVRGLLLIPALVLLVGGSSCPRLQTAASASSAASGLPSGLAPPAPLMAPPPLSPPSQAIALAAPPLLGATPGATGAAAPPDKTVASTPSTFGDLEAAPRTGEAPATILSESGEPEPAALDPNAAIPAPADEEQEEPRALEPEPPKDRARDPYELASTAKETWIYAEPRWGSRRLGYLRAGAIVTRRAKPSGFSSCQEGWYRVAPKGYVCVGAAATLNIHDPVVEASSRRPGLSSLPYTYALSRSPAPPLYARLPSEQEQLRAEPDLKGHRIKGARAALDPSYVEPPPADPTPGVLLYDRPAPTLANIWRAPDALLLAHAKPRSGFALLSTFDHEGRRFGLTTELAVVPLDRTRVVRPSSFSGLALTEDLTLPIAFVRSRHAFRYTARGNGSLVRGDALRFREAIPLRAADDRGGAARRDGVTYLEARDGSWVREDQIVRVDRIRHAPAWAAEGRKWIDVSILRQSLVAYEGDKPAYVTLVSTGADGLGDPKKTSSTIQGTFLIHTKHVTVTMDGEDGEEFDLRDVPFVQYFTEGFALHGAYWHDDFGTARSHGCVNLAPIDAAWLFGWTTPEVPKGWHAAISFKGTVVHTHP